MINLMCDVCKEWMGGVEHSCGSSAQTPEVPVDAIFTAEDSVDMRPAFSFRGFGDVRENVIDEQVARIREQVGDKRVICALSGGVVAGSRWMGTLP